MSDISQKRKLMLIVLVIILTLGNFEVFKTYLTPNPSAYISKHELEALKFLAGQKEGVILGYPYHQNAKDKFSAPYPIYIYESTSYLSAYTGKQQFAADRMNLDITGYFWQERVEDKWKFFTTDDVFWARGFLVNNQIDYIYLVDDQAFELNPQDLGVEMIYNQEKVRIYKVNR